MIILIIMENGMNHSRNAGLINFMRSKYYVTF